MELAVSTTVAGQETVETETCQRQARQPTGANKAKKQKSGLEQL
jgi:hypothetical protein